MFRTQARIHDLLLWDVLNGISRRAWAGNKNANWALNQTMGRETKLNVTVAHQVDTDILDKI